MPDQTPVDGIGFFDTLAAEMNAYPERYEVLGDLDLVLGVVITRPTEDAFRARLTFEGIRCADVSELDRKSTRLNSSHIQKSRMPSSA